MMAIILRHGKWGPVHITDNETTTYCGLNLEDVRKRAHVVTVSQRKENQRICKTCTKVKRVIMREKIVRALECLETAEKIANELGLFGEGALRDLDEKWVGLNKLQEEFADRLRWHDKQKMAEYSALLRRKVEHG
jgi:hypothetical protein